jgi:hypothetical protein
MAKAKKETAILNADMVTHLHALGDLLSESHKIDASMRAEITAIIAADPEFPSYLDGGKDSKELAAIKRELILRSYSEDEIATYDRICAVEDRRKRPLQEGYPDYTRMVENAKKKAQYLRRITREVIAAAATGNGDGGMESGAPRGRSVVRDPWIVDGERIVKSINRIGRAVDPSPEALQYVADAKKFLQDHKKLIGMSQVISKLI